MTKKRPILFKKREDCCGCSACSAICPTNAIEMLQDDLGFYYPVIDEKLCIACLKCKGVCFMNNDDFEEQR